MPGAKKAIKVKNHLFHACQPHKEISETSSQKPCNFITFTPGLLMATSIPGVEIFSWKSACVVFFYMQNWNFGGTSESERTLSAILVLRLWYRTLFSYHSRVMPSLRSMVWSNSEMARMFIRLVDTFTFTGTSTLVPASMVKGGTFLVLTQHTVETYQ